MSAHLTILMAILIKYALKIMEENDDPELNPSQNPQLNSSQNPELNDTQNRELASSQNRDLNPSQNPNWKNEEWRLLVKYLGDNLTEEQLNRCKRYLHSL